MLNMLNHTIKKLYRFKLIAMNNKISSLIFIVFMMAAFSCKSDGKKDLTSPVSEIEQKIGDVEPESSPEIEASISEDITTNEETETKSASPKEVKMPAKKNSSTNSDSKIKVISSTVGSGKVVQPNVDDNTKEINTQPKEIIKVATKPEKEVEEDKPSKPEKIEKFVGFPSHSELDGLLKKHVTSSGQVDYKGLKSNEASLDNYLSMLEATPPGTTWNRDQKLAYWINAYNAYTIKLILNNYPVKSITDLHGGKPWDVKWINSEGKSLSLNNIENDIIRPQFNEPRIHFAVNCAANSCPPLMNGAFMSKTLDAQLESQTKKFINNPNYNKLDKNAIQVSKIFDWYGEDFGNIASFVMRYADQTIKPSAKVTFLDYDWGLNGK
jgi:hypothetical protein